MMMIALFGGSSFAELKKVEIVTTPDGKITGVVTQSLNISCSLVAASSQDDSTDTADFTKITSVVINQKRNGKYEPIASLLEGKDIPTLFPPFDDAIDVSCKIDTGSIEFTVPKPLQKHTGKLQCVVRGNTKDLPKNVKAEVDVRYEAPSVTNLANYIIDLEKQLHAEDKRQDTEIKRQDKEDKRLQREVNRVEDETSAGYVAKADIQQGWARAVFRSLGPKTDTVYITFPHRYSKAPRVFLSLRYSWGGGSETEARDYKILAKSITQTGFSLECEVLVHSYISDMLVNWIAFPSP